MKPDSGSSDLIESEGTLGSDYVAFFRQDDMAGSDSHPSPCEYNIRWLILHIHFFDELSFLYPNVAITSSSQG